MHLPHVDFLRTQTLLPVSEESAEFAGRVPSIDLEGRETPATGLRSHFSSEPDTNPRTVAFGEAEVERRLLMTLRE
jgi:hypothetical protein